MNRALELALEGWGRVHPNPMVGAVIVQGDRIVAEGWHREYGGPHAEIDALRRAGPAARGATLYVTLEPCAHHGKTPPCTDAIVEAGIERVVYAAGDPNPEAAGGGHVLSGRGIAVTGGFLEHEATALDPAFHWAHRNAVPWVALKLAVSIDGRLGGEAGQPSAVTGPEALVETHRLRAGFDAILVGRGTVEADDPLLTVRGPVEPRVPPIRIVFDSKARTPPDGRLLRSIDEAPVWVVTGPDAHEDRITALSAAGARILPVPASHAGIDVTNALVLLRQEGIRSIFCEGGGRIASSLLSADTVQRLYMYLAPVFFGERGPPAFPGGAASARQWVFTSVQRLGQDLLVVAEPRATED